jgi:hypothetical protein
MAEIPFIIGVFYEARAWLRLSRRGIFYPPMAFMPHPASLGASAPIYVFF